MPESGAPQALQSPAVGVADLRPPAGDVATVASLAFGGAGVGRTFGVTPNASRNWSPTSLICSAIVRGPVASGAVIAAGVPVINSLIA